jgi:hypothetical protein
MSYRAFPPISGTYQSGINVPPNEQRWTASLESWPQVQFSGPWSTYDSGVTGTAGQPHWNKITGFALAAAISMGGWSGIALLVGYFWK